MRRSTDWILLAILIDPLGVASLWASYEPGHVAAFTPRLATGWACVACGLVAEVVGRADRCLLVRYSRCSCPTR